MEAIYLKDLSFRYSQDKIILDHINMGIKKGKITGIIGESGVGKTSLLRIMNGSMFSEKYQSLDGEIYINDQLMKREEDFFRKIGTVYQNPDNQIIFSNVLDELAFGMENMSMKKEKMEENISEVLALLDINHLRYRNPNELSGGEKQLIIVAAILCLDIDILIFDECMTQVDFQGKQLILRAMHRLRQENKTIIVVEHDYNNLHIADEIFQIKNKKILPIDKGSLMDNVVY